MKIGILTFHDGINHGGFFQAYALFKVLNSFGHDVTVINYKNPKHRVNEYRAFLAKKNPFIVYGNIKKIYSFRTAQKRLNLTPFTTSRAQVYADNYDAIIVGSDVVWDFKSSFLGSDPIYFGQELSAERLVSYSPSFGTVGPNDPTPPFVHTGLHSFSSISVRDDNSADIVEGIVGKRPPITLDPTFLYKNDGEEIVPPLKDYLLVYAHSLTPAEIMATRKAAQDRGLLTVSVGYPHSWCDKNFFHVGPFEWLGYFKNASCVVTSTFHGAIYCIKYRKPFYISMNQSIQNKASHLLKAFQLERQASESFDVSEVLSGAINYQDIESFINQEKTTSLNYLRTALQ